MAAWSGMGFEFKRNLSWERKRSEMAVRQLHQGEGLAE